MPALQTAALTPPTLHGYTYRRQGGSSSVVECFLAKEDVAGSTPVSRSKHPSSAIHSRSNLHGACGRLLSMRRGTQVVRERSAKPLCVGSIPTRASNILSHIHRSQGAEVRLPVASGNPPLAGDEITVSQTQVVPIPEPATGIVGLALPMAWAIFRRKRSESAA